MRWTALGLATAAATAAITSYTERAGHT
jgi:hypothetical protein